MRIVTIGIAAQQAIERAQSAQVVGITSRGIFLHLDVDRVVFLSSEPYRGPLTLILSGEPNGLKRVEPGDVVQVTGGSLYFTKTGLWLPMETAEVWTPAPAVCAIPVPDAVQNRLDIVSKEILEAPGLFAEDALVDLIQALSARHGERAAAIVEDLLGQGTGLTPSGDDLACGMLLALNRWRACFPADLLVEVINQRITRAATRKTTALSASLIACSAQGMADERLIQALDGLITGSPDAETCAALLCGWGHHSGCDAFVGMSCALAILT